MEMDVELQLVGKAGQGDQAAMYELYTATRNAAYFAAKSYLGSGREKELQGTLKDAYIVAFGRLEDLAPGRPFGEWLGGIVADKAMAALRKTGKIKFATKDEAGGFPDPRELFPEEWIEQEQRRWDVLRGIESLPDPRRLALLLHYMGRMNVPEIAAAMGIGDGTANAHLQKAKAAVRASAPDPGAETGAVPFLTRMLDLEAEKAQMPPELAKGIYQDVMLFFMSGGKVPKPGTGKSASASGGGGKLGGIILVAVLVVLVAIAAVVYYANYRRTHDLIARDRVAAYESDKAAGKLQLPAVSGEEGGEDLPPEGEPDSSSEAPPPAESGEEQSPPDEGAGAPPAEGEGTDQVDGEPPPQGGDSEAAPPAA